MSLLSLFEPKLIRCQISELPQVLCNPGIRRWCDKLQTILHAVYPNPHLQAALAERSAVFSMENLPRDWQEMAGKAAQVAAANEKNLVAMVAIGLLGPATKKQNYLASNIHNEMRKCGLSAPSVGQLKELIKVTDYSVGVPTVNLGPWLGMKKDGTCDAMAKKCDLMSPAEVKERYGCPDWAVKLMERARVLYEDDQMHTLRWGFVAAEEDEVKEMFGIMGGKFASELEALAKLKEVIGESPYAGLSGRKDTFDQSKNFPRILYVGQLEKEKRTGRASAEIKRKLHCHMGQASGESELLESFFGKK